MSRWQPWARRLGTVSAALALIVLLFSAMYLAADAEGLGANYAHYYPLVFVAAALALLLLALAIGSRLWKLRRQLNERMPGARTTRRLLILLLVNWRIGSGRRFAFFLVWFGISRFLVEFIRLNPFIYWGMSSSQLLSLFFILAGLAIAATSQSRIARLHESSTAVSAQD